jgi:hypothetical protein
MQAVLRQVRDQPCLKPFLIASLELRLKTEAMFLLTIPLKRRGPSYFGDSFGLLRPISAAVLPTHFLTVVTSEGGRGGISLGREGEDMSFRRKLNCAIIAGVCVFAFALAARAEDYKGC